MAKLQTVFIVETFFLSTTSKNVELQIIGIKPLKIRKKQS
jgi:hypothetical protein